MSKCIFLLFDGARPDVLKDLAYNGALPNVKKYFFDEGSAATATTVFPSTTGPAYLPFITGEFPGKCNIPGIRWLDREQFEKNPSSLSARRSYVGVENGRFNSDMSPNVSTIYEKIAPAFSINSIVTRGLESVTFRQSITQQLLMFYAKLSHHWSPVDQFAKKHLFEAMDKNYKFSFISFLGIDENSHLTDPFSEKTYESYKVLDGIVGELFARLEKTGERDSTLVVISSDHGLTGTDKHFELWKWFENRGKKVFYYPNIFRTDVDSACMVSGNAFANMYLKNGTSWNEYSYYEDLQPTGMLDELLAEPAIDQLFLRSKNGGCVALSASGKAYVKKDASTIEYRVEGTDPFGYQALPSSMNFQDALAKTFDTAYPDGLMQVTQLFDSPRTGDIAVTAKLGYDLRKVFEIPTHHGSHGALHKEHMLVPLLASHKILDESRPFRTIDIHQPMLDFMK